MCENIEDMSWSHINEKGDFIFKSGFDGIVPELYENSDDELETVKTSYYRHIVQFTSFPTLVIPTN